jgi:hypothetical protein
MQQAQSLSGPASASCGVIRETPVEKCFVFLNSVMLWRNELSAVNLGRFNEYSIDSYQISISQVNFKIELISLCCRKSQSPPISILQAEKTNIGKHKINECMLKIEPAVPYSEASLGLRYGYVSCRRSNERIHAGLQVIII